MRSIIRTALVMVTLLAVATIAKASSIDTYPIIPTESGQWIQFDPNSQFGVMNIEECVNDTCYYHYYLLDLQAKTWRPIPELNNANVYETLGWGSQHDYFFYAILGYGPDPYQWPILQLQRLSDFIATTAGTGMEPMPATLRVEGNTRGLTYNLPHAGTVNLNLFDVAGRRLATPVRGQHQSAGTYQLPMNSGLPSGVYFAQIRLDQETGRGTVRIVH